MTEIDFYQTDEWRRVRYEALKLYGGCCQCCGDRGSRDNPLHVDHIKPRSKYPHLALILTNLQVLCRDCNFGKGAWDQTDWRPQDVAELFANYDPIETPRRIRPWTDEDWKRWTNAPGFLEAQRRYDMRSHKYLVRKRGTRPRAHIIVNGDTACHLYSTGGILSKRKYEFVDELAEHHSVCTLCLRSVENAARRTANGGAMQMTAHHGDCQAQTGSEMPAGGRQSAA